MRENMKAKQFWLCKDGHVTYPLALFAEKPTYDKVTKGWKAAPKSTFRLTLSEAEAVAITSQETVEGLKESGMVAVYIAT